MERPKSDPSKTAGNDAESNDDFQTILFVMSFVFPFFATIAFAPTFRENKEKKKISKNFKQFNLLVIFIKIRLSFPTSNSLVTNSSV